VSRHILLAALAVAVLLAGCSGEAEKSQPAYTGAESETDEYMNNIYAEARQEWEPLAEAGDAGSQRQLGMVYYLGQGVPRDDETAYGWFEKAAVQGESVAQYSLGVMFAEGHGVDQDLVQAHMWLSLAAAQDSSNAVSRLATLTPELSREQITEGLRLAEEWKASHR